MEKVYTTTEALRKAKKKYYDKIKDDESFKEKRKISNHQQWLKRKELLKNNKVQSVGENNILKLMCV